MQVRFASAVSKIEIVGRKQIHMFQAQSQMLQKWMEKNEEKKKEGKKLFVRFATLFGARAQHSEQSVDFELLRRWFRWYVKIICTLCVYWCAVSVTTGVRYAHIDPLRHMISHTCALHRLAQHIACDPLLHRQIRLHNTRAHVFLVHHPHNRVFNVNFADSIRISSCVTSGCLFHARSRIARMRNDELSFWQWMHARNTSCMIQSRFANTQTVFVTTERRKRPREIRTQWQWFFQSRLKCVIGSRLWKWMRFNVSVSWLITNKSLSIVTINPLSHTSGAR